MPEEEMPTDEELDEMIEKDLPEGYGYPEQDKKDSIFKFFREILHTKDSKKVGNLTDAEIGTASMGIRNYINIAAYADAEGLNIVGNYLRAKGETIAATSMSRKGFLAQLFVTQIKKEQKLRSSPSEIKKGWFARKFGKEESQQEE